MANSQLFFNAKVVQAGVTLKLDIDLKTEKIRSLLFTGYEADHEIFYKELTEKFTERTLESTGLALQEISLNTPLLSNGKRPISSIALCLIRDALDQYLGESLFLAEERDRLCLCYSVPKKDIESYVLKDKNFELKNLIELTKASSACGSCKLPILETIEEVRLKHGLIKGMDHSRSRFDEQGRWIKIHGMYPGPLLIRLDELKNEWMKREDIVGKYEIFLKGIEGFHLEVETHGANQAVLKSLLSALTDFYQSKLGILFFLNEK